MPRQFTSLELRKYFSEHHQLDIGLYSYGCFDSQRIARGTLIGRYCSFADTARILNGNHGLDFLSLHPYLYNPSFGFVNEETIERSRCHVQDDVWLGHGSVLLPSVKIVGRGSVVGAGAVVTKNVPPYAIVAGNPAKLIRFRFDQETIDCIERTRWWELSAEELRGLIKSNTEMVFNPGKHFAARTALLNIIES